MDFNSEEKMLQAQIDSENARHRRQVEYLRNRKKALADKKQRQKEAEKLQKHEKYDRIEYLNNELKLLLDEYCGF